jgi:tRNA(Ser,Leu) C12 N-acetylase TAN1
MSSGKQQYELVTAMQPDSQENAIREITSRITNLEAKINTHQPDDTMVRLSCQQVAAAQLQLAVAGHS